MEFSLFIYLGFYVAFNTVQVISRRVVGRAEETSTQSLLGFCTVNCRPMASNYQLSHFRLWRGSNPGLRGGRRECYHSATVAPWNLVQDFSLDTFGYQRENNTKAKNKVLEMQVALELEDIWRINTGNSNLRKYTWFSSKQPRQMARLDFFLTTPDIHSQVKKHSISHSYRTDHSLLNLEINPFKSKRGKGFWKFHTSLLHDTAYIQLVIKLLKRLFVIIVLIRMTVLLVKITCCLN